jgi:hypothetical protein
VYLLFTLPFVADADDCTFMDDITWVNVKVVSCSPEYSDIKGSFNVVK